MNRLDVELFSELAPSRFIFKVIHIDLVSEQRDALPSTKLFQVVIVWVHPLNLLRVRLIDPNDLNEVITAFAPELGDLKLFHSKFVKAFQLSGQRMLALIQTDCLGLFPC